MRYNTILTALQNLTNEEIRQADIVRATGLIRSTVNYRCINNGEFNSTEINKIEQYYSKIYNKDVKLSDYICTDIGQAQEELVSIDYYPDVFGSCGSGCFVLSEEKEKIQVPKRLINSYSKVKSYSIINAYGDSMFPYIHDKDRLVIEFCDVEQITDNRVYVFRFRDSIFIKRLVLNINQLVIKSDNAEYENITLDYPSEDIQLIGKVVGLVRDME